MNVPEFKSVEEVLAWVFGLALTALVFLYRDAKKDNRELNQKIKEVYENHKDDLKQFLNEKNQTIVDINSTMSKVMMLLDQLKELTRRNG